MAKMRKVSDETGGQEYFTLLAQSSAQVGPVCNYEMTLQLAPPGMRLRGRTVRANRQTTSAAATAQNVLMRIPFLNPDSSRGTYVSWEPQGARSPERPGPRLRPLLQPPLGGVEIPATQIPATLDAKF